MIPHCDPAALESALRLACLLLALVVLARGAWQACQGAPREPLRHGAGGGRAAAEARAVGPEAILDFLLAVNLYWLPALLQPGVRGRTWHKAARSTAPGGGSGDGNKKDAGGEQQKEFPAARADEASNVQPPTLGTAGAEPLPISNSLACGSGGAPEANRFGAQLQQMLPECRASGSQGRLRMFDDVTVVRALGGATAAFTEVRCVQFRRLRDTAGVSEEQYYYSMCAKPFCGGKMEASGKSGSIFLRSHDGRLVLKTITEQEHKALVEVLPHLVLHLEHRPESRLCRILGAYALTVGGLTRRCIVMANLLQLPAKEVYDLKGTTEDRWVDPSAGGVLKDRNFKPYALLLEPEACRRLREAVDEDAEFLRSLGIMDYSLLVGVSPAAWFGGSGRAAGPLRGWLGGDGEEPAACDFQLGIIDYLQRWTPKKVAAHWLKKATIGCCHEIDTEPPDIYCKRFCKYTFSKLRVMRH